MIDFYCIHKQGDETTLELLNDAIESGKQFGINVIAHPGVYSDIKQLLASEKLFINHEGAHKVVPRKNGVIGCFLSHYFLWKKCIETNIPIGVLEYDAVFIKQLPTNLLSMFDDYLNLDYTRHTHLISQSNGDDYLKQINLEKNNEISVKTLTENTKAKNKHRFKYINNNHIRGAFGYIIKPCGAKKLVQAALQYGILPADIQPNLLYCDIKYVSPSAVMLNPNGLKDRSCRSHTNHDRTE
jgi:GR25 family glycosyltransferase involved in LPS biosynthesis